MVWLNRCAVITTIGPVNIGHPTDKKKGKRKMLLSMSWELLGSTLLTFTCTVQQRQSQMLCSKMFSQESVGTFPWCLQKLPFSHRGSFQKWGVQWRNVCVCGYLCVCVCLWVIMCMWVCLSVWVFCVWLYVCLSVYVWLCVSWVCACENVCVSVWVCVTVCVSCRL